MYTQPLDRCPPMSIDPGNLPETVAPVPAAGAIPLMLAARPRLPIGLVEAARITAQ